MSAPARLSTTARDTIVATAMGVSCPIGVGVEELWQAIERGEHGIRPLERFSAERYSVNLAATLPEDRYRRQAATLAEADPCASVGYVAAREAWESARLLSGGVPADRIAVVVGTSAAGIFSRSRYELAPPRDPAALHGLLARSGFHVQTCAIADALGALGPRITISTACASSTQAIAHASGLLRSGSADVVLAGGVDVLVEETFAGFYAMGAMSQAPCAPFSHPVGMSVGEGAGFIVMEVADHARARGLEPLCRLLGAGSAGDGWHPTAPDPTGGGIARAIEAALGLAGLGPGDVGYVNAHGTGTDANDDAEWLAIERVFGSHAAGLPVSSTKSYFGHALGAAGALELIVTILALRRQVVPPTLHYAGARGAGPTDPVATDRPRPQRFEHALSLSAAFGGVNAAVVVGRAVPADAGAPRSRHERPAVPATQQRTASHVDREIVVVGVGALSPLGTAPIDTFVRAAACPDGSVGRAIPALDFARLVRGADPRGLDTVSRQLSTQAALALGDAGLRISGELRCRAGLALGASRLPWDSATEFWDSIRRRGFGRASAPAFARIVMNAPAGALSRLFGLHGPLSVLANGPGAGLLAVLDAATHLSDEEADVMVAGSSFELSRGMSAHMLFRGVASASEGGACFVLTRAGWARSRSLRPRARLVRSAIAGPCALDRAIASVLDGLDGTLPDVAYCAAEPRADGRCREQEALLAAGLEPSAVLNPARALGYGESNDVLALAAAVEAIDAGRARTALVVSSEPTAASSALLLARGA